MLTVDTIFAVYDLLERMISLRSHFHCLLEAARSRRANHKLLERYLVSSVLSSIDDVEARERQRKWFLDVRQTRDMLVERDVLLGSRSIRTCNGNAKYGVGTELGLVGRTIEFEKELVDLLLLRDLESRLDECRGNRVVDVLDCLQDA